MKHPNFSEEKKLWKRGHEVVVGLDEAGRGPLAGPVVAAAVFVKPSDRKHSNIQLNVRMFSGVRDSKKLSAQQREKFYEIITNHPQIKWGIGIVSEKVIDKINILEATKLAMQKAINNLQSKTYSKVLKNFGISFLLIDGNFRIKSKIPQKFVIKGDEKVFSCSAAGIIAKVTRDRIMEKYHKKYPKYGFSRHKGYGTELHIKNIKKFGGCKIHRKTFYPVSMV